MARIIDNLNTISKKIDEAKKRTQATQDVTIIAVTKQVSTERAVEAVEAGLNHLGENRPEGLLSKRAK